MRDNSNLPGDNGNPNSPDYVEPDFGRDDAATVVAADLIAGGEVGNVVETVGEAEALLLWVGANVNVPLRYLQSYRDLLNLSGSLDKAITDTYEALNAYNDPRDDDE